jgi:hypothetical protein
MINLFPRVDAAIYRLANGVFADGKFTPDFDDPEDIEIIEPQPLRANDLQMLPEGERELNYLKTWTAADAQPGDRVAYDERLFKVVQMDVRSEIDAGFSRLLIREIKADEQ